MRLIHVCYPIAMIAPLPEILSISRNKDHVRTGYVSTEQYCVHKHQTRRT